MPALNYNMPARQNAHTLIYALHEKILQERVAKSGALAWRIYSAWAALKRQHPNFVATYDNGRSRIRITADATVDGAELFSMFSTRGNYANMIVEAINTYEKPDAPPICKPAIESIAVDLDALAGLIFSGEARDVQAITYYDALGLAFGDLHAAKWNIGIIDRTANPAHYYSPRLLGEIRAYRSGSRAEPVIVEIQNRGGRDPRNADFVTIADNLLHEFCNASGTTYRLP